MEDIIIIV